jgi:hypothetical protein
MAEIYADLLLYTESNMLLHISKFAHYNINGGTVDNT